MNWKHYVIALQIVSIIMLGILVEFFGAARAVSWVGISGWIAAGVGMAIVPLIAGAIGAALYKTDRLVGFVVLSWVVICLMTLGAGF